MKVLGIDAGYATTGWSIVEKSPEKKNGMALIDFGVIITTPKDALPYRLDFLYSGVKDLITEFKPDLVAVESLFYFKNQKTVMSVSQARGVILLAIEHSALQSYNYTPLQVKTAVTGYGRADKEQIQKMVQMIFGLKEIPKPDDAADAIAVAVCHINSN